MIDQRQYISTQDTSKPKPEDLQVRLTTNNYLRKSPKIPKSIDVFFLILHLMFGQDFGFGNLFEKSTAEFLKYYSIMLTLAKFIILTWPFMLVGEHMWYWCTILQCVVNFCIQKTAKYTIYNLLSDIHAAERIDALEKEFFGGVTSVYAIMMLIVKGFAVAVRCMFDHNLYCERLNHIYLTFYAVCSHAVDLIPEVQIIIRFYIYTYVKNMACCLKKDQDINKFIERYDKIADYQDKIRHTCDYLILMQLFLNTPKLMMTSWVMLDYINKERKWFTTMGEWVVVFHLALQIAIPATIVQLTNSKVGNIRQLLNSWNMVERDPEKNAEIVRVMNYLNVQNLQYKIWGIIPVDLRLPLSLISICTTYLIVIIQFTHLYD